MIILAFFTGLTFISLMSYDYAKRDPTIRPQLVDLNGLGAAQIATLTSPWSAL